MLNGKSENTSLCNLEKRALSLPWFEGLANHGQHHHGLYRERKEKETKGKEKKKKIKKIKERIESDVHDSMSCADPFLFIPISTLITLGSIRLFVHSFFFSRVLKWRKDKAGGSFRFMESFTFIRLKKGEKGENIKRESSLGAVTLLLLQGFCRQRKWALNLGNF